MTIKNEKQRRDTMEYSNGTNLEYYGQELTLDKISEIFSDFTKSANDQGYSLSKGPWIDIYSYYNQTTITLKAYRFESDLEYKTRLDTIVYIAKKKKELEEKKKDAEYATYLKLKKIYE